MRTFLIALSIALFIVSCQQDSAKTDVLPSGYEYVMHTASNGKAAEPGSLVHFHVSMRTADSLLRSTYEDPVMQMISIPDTTIEKRPLGFVEEALMLMSEGDSITISINLDTMQQKPPGMEEVSTLFYDISLREVETPTELEAGFNEAGDFISRQIEAYNAGEIENLQKTASGLEYVIHEEGSEEIVTPGSIALVQYYGALMDGTMFDNSFEEGAPFGFPVGQGQVIQGWDEGLTYLREGAKATFFIPAELGYGAAGSPPRIPENAQLAFYIEVENVFQLPQ